jgi:hypothetical protein
MTMMGAMVCRRCIDRAMREILEGCRQHARICGGRAGQAHRYHGNSSRQAGATS